MTARKQVEELLAKGVKVADIAKQVGISCARVYQIKNTTANPDRKSHPIPPEIHKLKPLESVTVSGWHVNHHVLLKPKRFKTSDLGNGLRLVTRVV